MTALEAAVIEASAALTSLGIPHVLIGGVAVSLRGEARATLDADFSLWVEQAQFEETVRSLAARFRPVAPDPMAFARRTRVLAVLTARDVRVDFVFAEMAVQRDMIARARPVALGGTEVPVASVEDLIWMKAMSEREKDQEDARRLVRRHRKTIDKEYLEPRLKDLAEWFARPEIVAMYRREISRP